MLAANVAQLVISVIVPAKNEARNIQRCLLSIKEAARVVATAVEIIVVDNGSTDETVVLSEALADRVIHAPGLFVGAVRNRGAAEARGGVLVFLDADCEVGEDYLQQVRTIFSAEERQLVGSVVLLPARSNHFQRVVYERRGARVGPVSSVGGAGLCISRTLFLELGGFSETRPAAEEAPLCAEALKIGVPLTRHADLRVYHHGTAKSFVELFRRGVWSGAGNFVISWEQRRPKAKYVRQLVYLSILLICAASVPRFAVLLFMAALCYLVLRVSYRTGGTTTFGRALFDVAVALAVESGDLVGFVSYPLHRGRIGRWRV